MGQLNLVPQKSLEMPSFQISSKEFSRAVSPNSRLMLCELDFLQDDEDCFFANIGAN